MSEPIFITKEQQLTQLVNEYAGSSQLSVEMRKHKINYSKIVRGAKVSFVLRHKDIKGGRLVVTL